MDIIACILFIDWNKVNKVWIIIIYSNTLIKESKIEAEQTRRSLQLKIYNSKRLKRLASLLSCLNGVDRVPCENGNLPTCNGIMKHYIFLCKENGEDNIPYVSNDNLFAR